MGYGEFDEDEYARFEEMMSFETSEEVLTGQHNGQLRTEGGDDTNALIERLKEMK
jgi:hypothetical protein